MPPQKSPGPASIKLKPLVGYNDHDVNSLKKRAPQWSFGERLKGISDDRTPSAAKYDTSKVTRFGKLPNVPTTTYKNSQKSKDGYLDYGPGSNRYNPIDVTIYKSHGGGKYSIGIRTKAIDGQCGPGPVVNAVSLDVYKKSAPKYQMFGRNKDLTDGKSPGPNEYSIHESKSKTLNAYPAYSFRFRLGDIKKDRVPGPTTYDLMNHHPFSSSPSYSLGRRHSEYANVLILPNDNC